ncbi:MAG: hypothetical protein ACJASQ_001187 [Crocinitomicaceae bacterium]|jgi:hypothetical protein
MVKKILIVLFFAILLFGVAVFQSGLKVNSQLILIALGVCTSLAVWFKIKSFQNFLLNMLVFIGSYTALFLLSTGILDLLDPNRASVVVDGETYKVMDWTWVSVMLFGIIGAVVVTLLYHYKLKKHGRTFELYFAAGFVGVCLLGFVFGMLG